MHGKNHINDGKNRINRHFLSNLLAHTARLAWGSLLYILLELARRKSCDSQKCVVE